MKEQKSAKNIPLCLIALIVVVASRLVLAAVYWYWKNETGSDQGLFSALFQWDCGWYSTIVENGYPTDDSLAMNGQASWAFFPLVHLLERLVCQVTGLPLRVAGSLMNTGFLFLLTWLGAKFCIELDGGRQQAIIFMLLLNFGHYNFIYSTLYTEACFAFLLCAALYCMYKKHWILMGICGALLSATRNLGIFLVFVIPFYCLQQYFAQKETRSIRGLFAWLFERPALILGTCLIPMGFFLYMRYLDGLVGDGMAFLHVEKAWGRTPGNPLEHLFQGLLALDSPDFILAVFALVALYLSLRQIMRRRPEGVLSLLFVLIPLSTSVAGMARYTVCSFPILMETSNALKEKSTLEKIMWAIFLFILGIAGTLKWFYGAVVMI